jgi:hypothetical protein
LIEILKTDTFSNHLEEVFVFKNGFDPILTETKPHIKTKAAVIIDFNLVNTVSPAGCEIQLNPIGSDERFKTSIMGRLNLF